MEGARRFTVMVVTANGSSVTETVNGIHLFVTTPNSFDLPIGATIVIAHSHAATNGF